MIIEFILNLIFGAVLMIISWLPEFPQVSYEDASDFFKILSVVNRFIDLKSFFSCILIMLASLNVELIWGMIEWVYKKIPGVE